MAFSWHYWPFQAAIPASFSSVVVRYMYDIKGASKVHSDFFFAYISLIIKNTVCKTQVCYLLFV